MSIEQSTQTAEVTVELRRLYGISEPIHRKYQEFGVSSLFDWQIDCLTFMKEDPTRNLVYSAPTSSGKTLIAEYMCIRTILKDFKKTLFILPFISVTNEKMLYYQKLLGPTSGIVVEGFMGSHGSFPSLSTVNLALCTIEKANSLINRLIEEGSLDVFGTVIVDELHMLQDGSRGVTLELILTKLKYMRTKGIQIQIIGMSATLPNLKELATWLNAELYETDFRPVPLKEYYIYEDKIFDIQHNFERNLNSVNEFEQICQLCLETIADNCSILIFCHTKNQCEILSKKIAVHFRQLGCNETSKFGQILRQRISAEKVIELLTQLKSSVCGFDINLLTPISFGVAYHHAGLTMHEREILENAFRQCAIRVLVATTTLSSGVNLPARRVIIRSLISFNKNPIQIMTYRQMIGRAGRMGKDTMGESYIMIKSDEKNYLKTYFSVSNRMKIIESALYSAGSEIRLFSRVVLEAIGNGTVESLIDLETFLKCTFAKFDAEIMFKSLNTLCNNQFVQKLKVNDEWKLLATAFGNACISANLDPFYAFEIYKELSKAQRSLALDSDLHMIYLLVPISAINSFENCNETISRIDWLLYKTLYKSLSESHVRVAKLIGINEMLLGQFLSNERKLLRSENGQELIKTFKRFLVALALQDLVNEVPLNVVANKFNCSRGTLQTLQNSAAMFAGMTQIFCAKLRWKNMELLIKQFEDRFMFGVEQELLKLLRLPVMNAFRARVLFNNGIETVMDIIKSDVTSLAKIIVDSVPYEMNHSKQSEKDKTRLKFLWIECLDFDNLSKSYDENLIEHFIAESLIKMAKSFQQQEIGCVDINWEKKSSIPLFPISQAKRLSTSDCFDTSDVKLYTEEPTEVEDTKTETSVNKSKSTVMQMITKAVSVPASEICVQKRRNDLLESNSSFKRYKTTSDCSFKTEMKNIENSKTEHLSEQKTTLDNDYDSDLKSFSSQPLFDESVFDDSKILDESMFVNDLSFGLNSTFLTPPDQIKSKYDKIEVVHVCDNFEYFNKFREKFIKLDEKFNFSLSACYLSVNEIVFSISMTIESEGLIAYLLKPTKYVHVNDIRDFVQLILKKRNFKVNCFDCKSFVCQWKYEIDCDFYDPKVANWILKPENKEIDFVKVCETYAEDMLEFVKQVRKSSDLNIIIKSCCIQTVVVQYLMQNLYKLMNEQQPYLKIFREEMDFMKTLIHLEQTGIRVDYNLLRKMREVIKTILINCNEKANKLNGHPVELGRKKLIEQIIRLKRKRQMLRNFNKEQDPIEILGQEYRSLHSILIKVINPLLRYTCRESGRVYGHYSIYTKTGRISIQNPSLQNVPKTLSILLPETIDAIADNEKKKTNICIRSVFIPRENFVFLSADFCQLELRILAHFSKDEDLCSVFKEANSDVFIRLAAKWFNVAKSDVTDVQRQKTKQICYGMLYGMGIESLSAKLQMQSKNEANEFLNSYSLENFDEKYEFSRLKQSMEMVGFTIETQRRLFSVLSAVLLLGNVQFQPRKLAYHHDEAVAVNNPEIVTLISDLLLVKQETLLAALTSKRARASGETLVINYRLPEATASRDAMAKCLYGALFDWIVLQVNHALLSKKDTFFEHQGYSIGVLDIFGFEDFGTCNSFEQLCINYANEHLQYYFNQHVFKYEQEEYRKEGIRWTNIDFMDNTGCLQLIEGKPNGLLCILDDQCNFPGATNETLLQKFNSVHRSNQFYETPQKREGAFIVLHYAGKVKYQVHEMREKNLDLMRQDIVSVLKNSSMAFVRELVGADPVAVFRWAIVRAFFRSYFALNAAGRRHRQNRSDKNKFVTSSYQNRCILINNNNKQRLPPRRQIMSSSLLTGNGTGYPLSNLRQCDYFSSKNRSLDSSSDYYYRTREPFYTSSISNSVLERMLCPNEARVLQKANQIVMKNKSFRPREKTSRRSLKNLQSVKTLAGRTGIQSSAQLNKARKQPLTVTAQFQNSLHLLMDTLNQANPFFIRCIKSNGNKIANRFDNDTVQRQLRYTGMLETVRIRQAGFNVRLTYDEFIQLYRILLPKGLLSSQNDVKYFLLTLNLNKDNYQLGISKIFFRESEKIKLDCKLHQQIMASIIAIQRWFRACLERRRFLRLKNAVILIQSYWRMTNAQRTLMILRNRLVAATQIQAFWRGYKTKKWFNKFKISLIKFQACIRGFNTRKKLSLLEEQNKNKKDLEIQNSHSDEAFISTELSREELIHDRHSFHESSNDALLHISNESGIQADIELDIKTKKPKDLSLRPTFSLPSVALRTPSSNMVFNCNSTNDKLEGLLNEGAILDSISLRKSKLNKMHKSIDSAENELFANFSLEKKPNEESLTTSYHEIETRQVANDKNNIMRTNNNDYSNESKISNNLPQTNHTINYKKTLESSISLPEVPIRAIRRTRRDMSRRSVGEDIPDATIPVNYLEAKNAILLGTINETNRNSNTTLKCDQNFNWQLRENLHDKHMNKSPHDLNILKNSELKRRNSDPSTTSCLTETKHKSLTKSNQTYSINPVSNSYELEWQSPNSFTIAGHRFRKITRFSKDDRCIYCNDEMDAFVTQGHKCVECKQLFHTKCIQNRGVLQMPCSAVQNNQENTFHNFDNSLTKTRRKYRKHTRTPYDFNKSIQHESNNTYNQQQSHYQQNASNFSLTGMPREFTDRTDKIISDAHELQLMQDFITKKIYKMESEEGQKPSEVDRVFKQALREFKDNLVATYSVVNKNGFESLNIKYKDLIASFYNVMETVSRQRHNDTDFPVTMGVNAFRGFMNEFMTTRNEFDKPSKSKRKKEKKRRKADDTISFAGHSFQLTIINIPTACEICNSFFMWPLERSLVCQSCKLTCHKKCYIKVQSECGKDSNNQSSMYSIFKVFGIPLHLLLTNECKIPVVIDRLITTIEMYGLYTEGIYRKSGVSSKVKELKQKMEECSQDSVNFENYQVHVLAAVLKSFLREMPEPLLTFDCYEDFIRAARLADSQERVSTLFAILRKLPKPNYDLMERLIFHLARVALNENVNRMNSNSLAIVFAPCILRTNTVLPAQDSLNDISRQTQSIEIIIIEQLKKLKSTLADIETLDTACHTATYRLSSLRCSKIFSTDDHPSITSNISTGNEKNNKNESDTQSKTSKNQEDEEEALLEGHIYEIKKEKAHLTSTLPTLTRSNSDEDILSTDLDGEGSVDDMSSYVIQNSSDLNDSSHVINKRAPLIRTISGHIDIRSNTNEKHKLLRRQLSNESAKLHSKAVPECDDTPIIV